MKSLLICVLAVALAVTLCGCGGTVGTVGIVTGDQYNDAQSYQVGDFTYARQDVQSIAINWRVGKIKLVQSDSAELAVSESGRSLGEKAAMHWLLRDGVLHIEFCASGASVSVMSWNKQLTVEVPKGVALDIRTTSAPVEAEKLVCGDVFVSSFSADMRFGNLHAANIALSSSSGAIRADRVIGSEVSCQTSSGVIEFNSLDASAATLNSSSGALRAESVVADALAVETSSGTVCMNDLTAKDAAVKTASGAVELTVSAQSALSVTTSSGKTTLTLPDGGAAVTYQAASGKLKTDAGYEKRGDLYVFGAGESVVEVKSSSGGLEIVYP